MTIRTHHTGVVRKRIVPIVSYVDNPPEQMVFDDQKCLKLISGKEIYRNDKEKPVGKIGSVIGNFGLAHLRLDSIDQSLSSEGMSIKAFPTPINKQ